MGAGGRGTLARSTTQSCAEVQRKTFSARLRTLRPRAPPGLWLSRWRALRTRTACAAHRADAAATHSCAVLRPLPILDEGRRGVSPSSPGPPASTCPGERTRAALPGAHLVPVRISAPRRCLFAPRNFHPPFWCDFSKPCSVWGFSHPLFPRSQAHFGAWRGRARWRTATATASGAAPAAAEAANATAAAVKDSTRKRRAFHEVTASPAPRRQQDNTETRALAH